MINKKIVNFLSKNECKGKNIIAISNLFLNDYYAADSKKYYLCRWFMQWILLNDIFNLLTNKCLWNIQS